MSNNVSLVGARSYFVEDAAFCKVGKEWNGIWNPRNNPTGQNALYYRTDNSSSKAILHMLDGTLELEAGKIYFIPAFSVLYSEIDGEMEKYYIHFHSDLVDFGLHRHLLERCSVEADNMTKPLFDTIVENYNKKTAAAERKVCGAMEILLADILENFELKTSDVEKFRPVLEFVEEHYREKITVSQLAKILNISTMYFSNAFKAAFHVSPKQYILCKRLLESRILLARTDLSVREIAEKVGFENENYFSEFFSAKVGISALKFRNKTKKSTQN